MSFVACSSTKTNFYTIAICIDYLSGDHFHELVREVLPIDLVDVEICDGKVINLQVLILVMGSNWGMEGRRRILGVRGSAARARCSTM
jgi:hypothetical protein